MKPIKTLITSPSLDTSQNVGGISNLTKLLIDKNNDIEYKLFVAGKKDQELRNIKWFFRQFEVLLSFYKELKNNIDLVHINMPLEKFGILRDSMFAQICRLTKTPYLMHIRGGLYMKNQQTPAFLKQIIKKTLDKAKHVIVLGETEKEFINLFYQTPTAITALPNAVELPKYQSKTINKIDPINILFLGRIDKNKGLVEIVDALGKLKDRISYIFHIAGEGPDKGWFLEQCNQKLNGKFRYQGVVSGTSKKELLAKSDIFLLPSYYEGLPNALLEAMAYGCVPIVTPVGSIPEVVIHKVNGVLIPSHNSVDIINSILFLSENEGFYVNLSKKAYSFINNRFTISQYIIQLNKIYNQIMVEERNKCNI